MKNNTLEPPKKKIKIDASIMVDCLEDTWLKLDSAMLKQSNKRLQQIGERLNDHHIKYAQAILKKQFPCLEGLQLTLLQEKNQDKIQNGIQIIFCQSRQNWVVASTIVCGKMKLKFMTLFSMLLTQKLKKL